MRSQSSTTAWAATRFSSRNSGLSHTPRLDP
jgi:hypothetical protein